MRVTRFPLTFLGITLVISLSACSSTPAGEPKVIGMTLDKAEQVLDGAKITYDEHPLDGTFGIIVKENWIVCKQVVLGSKSVRLDVAKYGC